MPFEHLKDEEKSLDLYGIELNGKYTTAELSSLIKGHDIVRLESTEDEMARTVGENVE
jgi:hypothetical protein